MLNLTEIIKRVQRKGGVTDDGDAGAETWQMIARKFGVDPVPPALTSAGARVAGYLDELAQVAESQIGTQEDAGHSNRGDAILKFQRSTDLDGQGWPWCAAFVDWCVEQLYAKHPEFSRRFPRPRTASAFGLIEWGRKAGCIVFSAGEWQTTAPGRGDLVVYEFSHCGIVSDVDLAGRVFHAIEGNTNADGSRDGYTVARKSRNFSSVKSFIRIPAVNS